LKSARNLEFLRCVVRPTLIYGRVGVYVDRNLSKLLQFLRRFLVLPIPAQTGSPSQFMLARWPQFPCIPLIQVAQACPSFSLPKRISIGGDTTLSYAQVLSAMQFSLPSRHSARFCLLLPIPNRLLFLFVAFALLASPKTHEALLCIAVNLSGFTAAHEILGQEPQPFPLEPFI